jgi:hypothetical protein
MRPMVAMMRFLVVIWLAISVRQCLGLPPAGVPIELPTPADTPTPTPLPTATPFPGVVVVLTPSAGPVDPEAEIHLDITISDQYGRPLRGTVRVIWPEKGGEVPYGPVTWLDLKLRISGHVGGPLIVQIEAAGYATQRWWFEGELDADYSYPLHVRLLPERRA